MERGSGALTDAELLAIFFRSGTQGANAVDMARSLLKQFGSLQGIARASMADYQKISGIGPVKAVELAAVFEMAGRVAREEFRSTPIDCADAVYAVTGPELRTWSREVLRVLLLDTRKHLIRIEDISIGTLNETTAHPREILRPVLAHAAHSFILVHNHPSGDPTPSRADRALTRRIADAAVLMQIEFVDHVIIGHPKDGQEPFFSFREMGLL